jgi:hypothetical protein
MKNIALLIICLCILSCESKNVEAEFIEVENGLARFDIYNRSDRDIRKITFEITFLDHSGKPLLLDTLLYQMGKEHGKIDVPFLKAKDRTFIVQRVPEDCQKADIKVLEFESIQEY